MKRFIQAIVFILLIIAFIYLGTRDYKVTKKNIEHKTPKDVLVNNDTVFIETNHSKLLNKISSKNDFILYACINENKLCAKYGLLIDEVAKSYKINDIYYYDFSEDRNENNATYQKILTKLDQYLLTDDQGKQNLYAPTLIFFKNGLVYSFDDSLSFNRGNTSIEDLWTEEQINIKKIYLNEVMKGFVSNE